MLAALAVAFGWRERSRWVAAHREQAQLAQRYLEVTDQIFSANLQAAELRRARGGATAAPAAPPATAAALASLSSTDVVAMDATLRAEYLRAQAGRADFDWGLLFRMLKLSPDQIARFKALQAELTENDLTVRAAAAQQGVPPYGPEMEAFDRQLNQPVRQELRALLGQPGYAAYKQYNQDSNVVPFVQDLAGYLGDQAPTLDQSAQLITALADSSQKKPNGWVIYHTVDPDQAVTRASSFLSPTQVSTLGAILRLQQAKQALNQLSAAK